VLPRDDGYGLFPSLTALPFSLGAQCRAAFVATKADGSVTIFAATATDLYIMNNSTFAWTKVSKGGGPYSSVVDHRTMAVRPVQQSGDRRAGQYPAARE
jgi:hypothetical protein